MEQKRPEQNHRTRSRSPVAEGSNVDRPGRPQHNHRHNDNQNRRRTTPAQPPPGRVLHLPMGDSEPLSRDRRPSRLPRRRPPDIAAQGMIPDRCQPATCRNSVITEQHLPIWVAEEQDLMARLRDRKMAAHNREQIESELTTVQKITRKVPRDS